MMSDGVKNKDQENEIHVKDIAELILKLRTSKTCLFPSINFRSRSNMIYPSNRPFTTDELLVINEKARAFGTMDCYGADLQAGIDLPYDPLLY